MAEKRLSWFERTFPRFALKQETARIKLAGVRKIRARYDAADFSRLDRKRYYLEDEKAEVARDVRKRIRDRARQLEKNTFIVPSILESIVSHFVGAGIIPNPVARKKSGKIHETVNEDLARLWQAWAVSSELSGMYSGEAEAQGLMVRSLYRDGEAVLVHHMGIPGLEAADIPYTYQLMEADAIKEDQNHPEGMKLDRFGRATEFLFEVMDETTMAPRQVFVDAKKVSHMALRIRANQRRGVSAFAPIVDEIVAIDEIDESELIAAKIASMLAVVLNKGEVADYKGDPNDEERQFEFEPGMVVDDLELGERMEILESNRPSNERMSFRKVMLQAVAGGFGPITYSRMARDYAGTYSSQRQELVEARDLQLPHWQRIVRFELAKWKYFVQAVELAGLITIPRTIDRVSLMHPDYAAIVTPWIDPAKEAAAYKTMIDYDLESRRYIASTRGRDERVIRGEILEERNVYTKPTEQGGEDEGKTQDPEDN